MPLRDNTGDLHTQGPQTLHLSPLPAGDPYWDLHIAFSGPGIGLPCLVPQTQDKARQARHLVGRAGACRWIWNHFLARQQRHWQRGQAFRVGPKSRIPFFGMGKAFTVPRRETPWLQAYS